MRTWQKFESVAQSWLVGVLHAQVVPETVQRFIKEVEGFGGAGKICGAGAVAGEKGGVVLVLSENQSALQQLCTQYDYHIIPISGVTRGVHVV